MKILAQFAEARKAFHSALLKDTLMINSGGVVSNADSSNTASKAIAKGIAELLKAETMGERIAERVVSDLMGEDVALTEALKIDDGVTHG